jgi:hypothetical protein
LCSPIDNPLSSACLNLLLFQTVTVVSGSHSSTMVAAQALHPAIHPPTVAPWASLAAAASPTPQTSLTTLRFEDAALEQAYVEATTASFCTADQHIASVKWWISSLLLLPILSGHVPATSLGKCLWVIYVCLLSAHLTLMRLAPKMYQQQRHLLIIPVKAILGLALTAFVPTFVLNEAHSLSAYAELLLLGAGLVMQLCTGR